MTKPILSSSTPPKSRLETRLIARWTPVIGPKYAQALAVGKESESRRYILVLPFSFLGLAALKNNVMIGDLIIAVGIIYVVTVDYFAAKRLRRVGEAIVMDLKRLGLNPSSIPKLKRIPAFERWMITEGLPRNSVREAGLLGGRSEGFSQDQSG